MRLRKKFLDDRLEVGLQPRINMKLIRIKMKIHSVTLSPLLHSSLTQSAPCEMLKCFQLRQFVLSTVRFRNGDYDFFFHRMQNKWTLCYGKLELHVFDIKVEWHQKHHVDQRMKSDRNSKSKYENYITASNQYLFGTEGFICGISAWGSDSHISYFENVYLDKI